MRTLRLIRECIHAILLRRRITPGRGEGYLSLFYRQTCGLCNINENSIGLNRNSARHKRSTQIFNIVNSGGCLNS